MLLIFVQGLLGLLLYSVSGSLQHFQRTLKPYTENGLVLAEGKRYILTGGELQAGDPGEKKLIAWLSHCNINSSLLKHLFCLHRPISKNPIACFLNDLNAAQPLTLSLSVSRKKESHE
jgi:hypothetical protein